MDTGSYDTNRLFTTDSGPTCSWCPKCDCGEYKFNDTWYVEYQSYYGSLYDYASCAKCRCEKDSYDNLYADCDDGVSYDIGDNTCNTNTGIGDSDGDDYIEYSCHFDENTSGLLIKIIDYVKYDE